MFGTKRRSFFERLTGSVMLEDEKKEEQAPAAQSKNGWIEEEIGEAELPVDMYQTPTEIILKALVAGVKPDNLQISITREMVTIRGKREEQYEAAPEDTFFKELYWGSFGRTIVLPQEVEAEDAEAVEKNGLLTLRLPKLNKGKVQNLRVKSL